MMYNLRTHHKSSSWVLHATLLLLLGGEFGCAERPDAQAQQPLPTVHAVVVPDSATQARFDEVMHHAREAHWHTLPMGQIMQAVGMQFLGTPYEGFTLDEPEEETLSIKYYFCKK